MLSPRGSRRWFTLLFFLLFLFVYSRGSSLRPSSNFWSGHRIKAHAFPGIEFAATDANGFLHPSVAEEFCNQHNFDSYPQRKRKRKVYDLFMINTELEWLDIRLNELADHVDYFVILEAQRTFTGLPKPLYIRENWERFKPFHAKIILRVLDDAGFDSNTTWDHEDLQRNALFDQVLSPESFTANTKDNTLSEEQIPNPGDVILVSDVDEIPKPQALTIIRNCDFPRRLTLRSRFYYYSFQWLHRGEEWPHPQATFYEGADTIRPADLRNGEGSYGGRNLITAKLDKANLWNSSWHCSTCFSSIEETRMKMSSFSHTKLNQEHFRKSDWVVNRVRNGLDLFNRPSEIYDKVKGKNWDVPRFLLQSMDSDRAEDRTRFSYLLDRDPPNANFKDLSLEEAQAQAQGQ